MAVRLALLNILSFACGTQLRAESPTAVAVAESADRRSRRRRSAALAEATAPKSTLRLCNAYALRSALDIWVDDQHLTPGAPEAKRIPYGACMDYDDVTLAAGSEIDFRLHDALLGVFTISDMPLSDDMLLVVISREHANAEAAAFQSHVLPASSKAQVAVINAYHGEKKFSNVYLHKASSLANATVPTHSEHLHYGSIVAVSPGDYEAALLENGDLLYGHALAKENLFARSGFPYVVLRIGCECENEKFPEELVVFPKGNPEDGVDPGIHPAVLSGLLLAGIALAALADVGMSKLFTPTEAFL